MGRFKVPMEYINNAKNRKNTFKTRKTGIIKKALELTTLCDVNVSMIICSTDDHHQEPTIFPPDHHKLTNLYTQNRIMEPQKIRYYSLSDYFKEKTMKLEEELVKAKMDNLAAKYPTWFDFINDCSEVQLRELAFGLESKIDAVKKKAESLKNTSKIQNKDNNTMTMSPTTVFDVHSSSIMPPLNPYLPDYDDLSFDPEELFVDENNDDLSFDPKELFADEDENKDNNLISFDPEVLFSDENNKNYFHLQSPQPPYYCCLPEILQQPEPPLLSDQDNFNMQSSNTDSAMKMQSSNLTEVPNPPLFSDSMMKLLMSEDDIVDDCYPLPPPAYGSPQEIMQQLERPLFYSNFRT